MLKSNGRRLSELHTDEIFQPLHEHGLVLLRDFATSLHEFEKFTDMMCVSFHQVGTRKPIVSSKTDGNTSEVHGSNFNLFAHSEGAYRPYPPPPDLCFFNCVVPPALSGGETLLIDGALFLKKLPIKLRQLFEQQEIVYQAVWDEPRWQTEFRVENLPQLDQLLENYPQCSYRLVGDAIEVRCQAPAIQTSLGGNPSFANGLLAHLPHISHPGWQNRNAYCKSTNQVFFTNGQAIADSIVNELIDIQDGISLAHRWQANDLLVLDNRRTMHGRRMTVGDCERQIRSRFGHVK